MTIQINFWPLCVPFRHDLEREEEREREREDISNVLVYR